jgi:hypothetical protein
MGAEQSIHSVDITDLKRIGVKFDRRLYRTIGGMLAVVAYFLADPQSLWGPAVLAAIVVLSAFYPRSLNAIDLLRRVDLFGNRMFAIRIALLRFRWRLNHASRRGKARAIIGYRVIGSGLILALPFASAANDTISFTPPTDFNDWRGIFWLAPVIGMIALWRASWLKSPRTESAERLSRGAPEWFLGQCFRFFAVAIVPIILGCFIFWENYLKSIGQRDLLNSPLGGIALYALVMLGFAASILFWDRGTRKLFLAKRLTEPMVKEERGRDSRRPVVFLRSFAEDQIDPVVAEIRRHWGQYPTFELGLASAARRYGPFIAIAQPGQLSPGGAAREEFSNERWQTAVRAWTDEALFIVLMAGITPGLHWELQHLIQQGHLAKLIILLPRSSRKTVTQQEREKLGHDLDAITKFAYKLFLEERQEVWEALCRSFEGTIWYPSLVKVAERDILAASWDAKGNLLLLRSQSVDDEDYETALDLAVYAMFCFEKQQYERPRST